MDSQPVISCNGSAAPEAPSRRSLALLDQDVLALIANHLYADHHLVCFCLACSAFNTARKREGLPLCSDGKAFVRRLRLLEWAVAEVDWLAHATHAVHGCVWAAEVGCLPTLLWLRGEGLWLCGEDCLAAAAGGGHNDVLVSLSQMGCVADWRTCAAAAAEDHLETLMVARLLGFCWDEMVCANAAGAGALELLKWARQPNWAQLPSPLAWLEAVPAPSPTSSPPMQSRRLSVPSSPVGVANDSPSRHDDARLAPPGSSTATPMRYDTVIHATAAARAVLGSTAVASAPSTPPRARPPSGSAESSPSYLRSPCSFEFLDADVGDDFGGIASPGKRARAYVSAAHKSALRPHAPSVHAIKQHLIDSRCSRDTRPAPWDSWTIAAAAAGGHVAVLEWMWSLPEIERPAVSAVACAFAAASGQLNGLMWLRDKGAPWDEQTCAEAASGGHLEILKFCRASGCPWDGETAAAAAGAGHLEVLKFCVARECPLNMADCLQRARDSGSDAVVSWLLALPERSEDELS